MSTTKNPPKYSEKYSDGRYATTGAGDVIQKLRQQLRDRDNTIKEMREALQANQIFHTPIMRLKLGREWDEFESDAITRTKACLGN